MSVQHLSAAMFGCPGLDPAVRLVLIHLANNADPETGLTAGTGDADVDWIMRYTGLGAGQVLDAFGQLVTLGLMAPDTAGGFLLHLPDEEA